MKIHCHSSETQGQPKGKVLGKLKWNWPNLRCKHAGNNWIRSGVALQFSSPILLLEEVLLEEPPTRACKHTAHSGPLFPVTCGPFATVFAERSFTSAFHVRVLSKLAACIDLPARAAGDAVSNCEDPCSFDHQMFSRLEFGWAPRVVCSQCWMSPDDAASFRCHQGSHAFAQASTL